MSGIDVILEYVQTLNAPPKMLRFESPQTLVVAYSIIYWAEYSGRFCRDKRLNLSWNKLSGINNPIQNALLESQLNTVIGAVKIYNETVYENSGAFKIIESDLVKMRAIPEFKKAIEICDEILGVSPVNRALKDLRPDLLRSDTLRLGIQHFFGGDKMSLSQFTTESLNGYWVVSLGDLILLSEPPLYIKTDEIGQLHCGAGPAIEYSDGFKIWSWRGWSLEEEYIMNPESLPYDRWSKKFEGLYWIEGNKKFYDLAELVGYSYFFEKSRNKRILDEDYDRKLCHRQLVSIDWCNFDTKRGGDLHLLVLGDGTERAYLKIPSSIETCSNAVAWSFGKRVREYQPVEET